MVTSIDLELTQSLLNTSPAKHVTESSKTNKARSLRPTSALSESPIEMAEDPCWLLDIPTELRLRIYNFAIVKDVPIQVNVPCKYYFRQPHFLPADDSENRKAKAMEIWDTEGRSRLQQPSLTRTCRLIRSETLEIFYGSNVFEAHFCDPDRREKICTWFEMIGPANCALLSRFYLVDWVYAGWSPNLIKVRGTLNALQESSTFMELQSLIFGSVRPYMYYLPVQFKETDGARRLDLPTQ